MNALVADLFNSRDLTYFAHLVRDLCGSLWCFVAFASIFCAASAFNIQRRQSRREHLTKVQSEHELKVHDSAMKDPNFAQAHDYPGAGEILLESHRASLRGAEVDRWKRACHYWMIATGLALAALVMLCVSTWTP